jgi:hypothetical protein
MLRVLFFPLSPRATKGDIRKPTNNSSKDFLTRKNFHSFYKLGIPTLRSKTQYTIILAA